MEFDNTDINSLNARLNRFATKTSLIFVLIITIIAGINDYRYNQSVNKLPPLPNLKNLSEIEKYLDFFKDNPEEIIYLLQNNHDNVYNLLTDENNVPTAFIVDENGQAIAEVVSPDLSSRVDFTSLHPQNTLFDRIMNATKQIDSLQSGQYVQVIISDPNTFTSNYVYIDEQFDWSNLNDFFVSNSFLKVPLNFTNGIKTSAVRNVSTNFSVNYQGHLSKSDSYSFCQDSQNMHSCIDVTINRSANNTIMQFDVSDNYASSVTIKPSDTVTYELMTKLINLTESQLISVEP